MRYVAVCLYAYKRKHACVRACVYVCARVRACVRARTHARVALRCVAVHCMCAHRAWYACLQSCRLGPLRLKLHGQRSTHRNPQCLRPTRTLVCCKHVRGSISRGSKARTVTTPTSAARLVEKSAWAPLVACRSLGSAMDWTRRPGTFARPTPRCYTLHVQHSLTVFRLQWSAAGTIWNLLMLRTELSKRPVQIPNDLLACKRSGMCHWPGHFVPQWHSLCVRVIQIVGRGDADRMSQAVFHNSVFGPLQPRHWAIEPLSFLTKRKRIPPTLGSRGHGDSLLILFPVRHPQENLRVFIRHPILFACRRGREIITSSGLMILSALSPNGRGAARGAVALC